MKEFSEMSELDILFEDDDVLAIMKPAWLLVHRGMANDEVTLVDLVRKYTGRSPHPMHRLDRQTSGVILFAKTPESAKLIRAQFENNTVEKQYVACVRGTAPASGIIDNSVPKSEGGERVSAVTTFRRLSSSTVEPREVSIVQCSPQTGRFHQIRRHLKHINHPILMDANYGKTKLNRAFKEKWGLPRLALHATTISFDHPSTNQRCTIEARIPEDLRKPLKAMGLL